MTVISRIANVWRVFTAKSLLRTMALSACALIGLAFAPAASWAEAAAEAADQAPSLLRYREGEHYQKVPIPVAPAAKSGDSAGGVASSAARKKCCAPTRWLNATTSPAPLNTC